VALANRSQTVSSHDNYLLAREIEDGTHDQLFGYAVQSTGCFIQDKNINTIDGGCPETTF
jgi:hypothetical protein